jgi:hypothetical protein
MKCATGLGRPPQIPSIADGIDAPVPGLTVYGPSSTTSAGGIEGSVLAAYDPAPAEYIRAMRTLAVVMVVAACGGNKEAGSGSGSVAAPAPQRPELSFAGCAGAPLPPPNAGNADWAIAGPIGHGGGTGTGKISHGAYGIAKPLPDATGEVKTTGALDKEIIRRSIRRQIGAVTACYEKQLLVDPRLAGKVEAHFVIGLDGKVTSSTADGMNKDVASCIAKVIEKIEFPAPKGGVVKVNYPFVLRSAGGAAPPPAPAPAAPPSDAIQQAAITSLLMAGNQIGKKLAQWTPYAQSVPQLDAAAIATAATAGRDAMKAKLPELERCFAKNDATGSLRAMLSFAPTGELDRVRVGGLGDAAAETCFADALRATKLPAAAAAFELACDFSRGRDALWRVTPTAGYELIAAKRDGLELGGTLVPFDRVHDAKLDRTKVALIVADADAPATAMLTAVQHAGLAPATLVAVRADGPLELLAMVAMTGIEHGEALELAISDGVVRSCGDGSAVPTAPLRDPAALDKLFEAARKGCPPSVCAANIVLGASAADVAALGFGALRAGYQRVGIIESGCER